MLQRERYDLAILNVHRLVRGEVELVPPTKRFGTERERHLEVIASGLRGGRRVYSMWSLDEVGDQDPRALELPVTDVEPL